MKLMVSVFLVLIIMVCLNCNREAEWRAFRAHEGGFAVEAPGVLEEQIATMGTMIGSIQFTAYVLEKDRTMYMVGYSDWPDTLVEKKPADELLDFAIEGAITSLKGKVTRNTTITLGKYQGRELVVDQVTMNQEHTIRVYLVGSRMYQLSVLIPKREEFNQNKGRFLNSFQLLR